MEKPIEYKEMATRHIYAYHNTAGKRSISRSEKVKVSAEEATKWLDAQYGKEALLILKKILEISDGKDSCDIKLHGNGELRMLFMTGDGIDYKSGNMSDEQAQATKRAYKRFEDLKRRGYLDGNGSVLYITLKGKEYFYQSTKNAEKVMTGNKRAAQEPQN